MDVCGKNLFLLNPFPTQRKCAKRSFCICFPFASEKFVGCFFSQARANMPCERTGVMFVN